MNRFKNILYVSDGQTDTCSALERAMALAENNHARLTVVDVIDAVDEDEKIHERFGVSLNRLLHDHRLNELASLIEPYQTDDQIIYTRVLSGSMFAEIIKMVMQGNYDLENSYVIGDRITDIELARNMGTRGILYIAGLTGALSAEKEKELQEAGLMEQCAMITGSWDEIGRFLRSSLRKARVSRATSETAVDVQLSLDGSGVSDISTGLGFFDHMLEQIARHGHFDLQVQVKGDLHVDEHHTIEDTGLALGEAFLLALGDKKGINRYGFTLPMDDVLASAAVDFGGRPWLVWDAVFNREMIGDVPTEMFFHFFKSFSDTSKSNINIKAEGSNEHHKIEAIFKVFSKALRGSVTMDRDSDRLPSTKGVL